MAEGSDKITITIKTPREKKDVTVKEDASVKDVRVIDYLLKAFCFQCFDF